MTERILVVEDSQTQAELVRLVLEDEGYQVVVAENGRVALERIKESPPDLVLSDIMMPEMDGHELCQAMKADEGTRVIPVVMLTSLQAQHDRIRALENGADDFLSKPVDPDELVARVRSLLRLKAVYDKLLQHDQRETQRVLVAEDSRTEAENLRALLEEAGYEIELVTDGRSALARARAAPPDLVLTDVIMPEMDGVAFCRALKAADATRRIPVIMLTSLQERGDRILALEAGADDFLTKPIDRAELLARARSLLRLKALHDQLTQRGDEIARQAEELAKTNAELVQLTVELEDRVAARTAELESKTEELKATSQQLWQTAKLATMGELAASVAHELNNPLATVSLRIESMLASTAEDDQRRRSLEIVDAEVERMARLVARLLEFSRHTERQISTIDLPSEIANSLELVQGYVRNRRVTPVTEYASGPLTILADRQQLRQVLLNLITNACDAMESGGTLTIRVYREDSAAVQLAPDRRTDNGGQEGRPTVVIEIADTGSGISPADLARVTEPFFTTKPEGKGTGLGLAICRRIVQEHAGKLEIASEVGVGTTIRVKLPAPETGPNGGGRGNYGPA
ncbi:MAG TPA: response regulator [Chloroflexota bacterium]|nr:response regulator [Chloroflexota bacterium]